MKKLYIKPVIETIVLGGPLCLNIGSDESNPDEAESKSFEGPAGFLWEGETNETK